MNQQDELASETGVNSVEEQGFEFHFKRLSELSEKISKLKDSPSSLDEIAKIIPLATESYNQCKKRIDQVQALIDGENDRIKTDQ